MSNHIVATDSVDDNADPAPAHGADLVAFSSPQRTMWGTGCALSIEVPAPWPDNIAVVAASLRTISGDGSPLAFAALPYDRSAAGHFLVPEVLHTHTAEGQRWVTTVAAPATGTGGSHPGSGDPNSAPRPSVVPAEITVQSVMAVDAWCTAVERARERIRSGELTKVVLAREIALRANGPFDAATIWDRLRNDHPGALNFAIDGFVGASPELLVSRSGSTVRAQPMAGTTPRSGHPELDQRRSGELLASDKNRTEHQITIDAVHDALLGWCSYLDAEPTPSVVPAGSVQHLATLVEGRLSSPEPSVLELVAALHPTPAVGGWPTEAALSVQADLEGARRGRYAGPVGWVDRHGNGAFAVGIRSVQIDGGRASMFTGVGVVADSDPQAELAETRAKAQSLLGTLLRL